MSLEERNTMTKQVMESTQQPFEHTDIKFVAYIGLYFVKNIIFFLHRGKAK